ncbi:glutathione S-transferase kappa 1 [Entomortierella parvispora]|uniref:Glutathione S-transferase kappa n=1 Tax=Entomortierella parvispora TaxID=205924 RepID=A0A9P3HLS7_9FUNG|nr:glutathione S-transferase kappa 1 [Entomortierella parvispora]
MTSPASIVCYYDIVSPYSYFGVMLLNRYKEKWGDKVQVELRPMFLHGIMTGSKNQPPANVPAKGTYMFSDLNRICNMTGIPYSFPSQFPVMTVHVMRLLIVIQKCEPALYQACVEALYGAYWGKGEDVTQKEVIMAALAPVFNGSESKVAELIQMAAEKDIKQKLVDNTNEALDKGAFGAPWFVVKQAGSDEEHFFFGSDRFELMTNFLDLPYYGLAVNKSAKL